MPIIYTQQTQYYYLSLIVVSTSRLHKVARRVTWQWTQTLDAKFIVQKHAHPSSSHPQNPLSQYKSIPVRELHSQSTIFALLVSLKQTHITSIAQ